MSERYKVAEASGYPMGLSRRHGGNRWITEYMVLDTATFPEEFRNYS